MIYYTQLIFIKPGREQVTFGGKADFEGYKTDPKRLAFMEMKNNSVENIILIEGVAL